MLMDYGHFDGESCCPKCLDVPMQWNDEPVWATDQSEVFECRCPGCGHVEHYFEVFPLADEEYEWAIWIERHSWQFGTEQACPDCTRSRSRDFSDDLTNAV